MYKRQTLSRALLLTACTACSLSALGDPAALHALDPQWQQQQQQRTSQQIVQHSQPPAFDLQAPAQRGNASLEPMYSCLLYTSRCV